MSAYLSPIGNEQQSDASGNPLAGGFIFTYLAGTSTLAATFTDADGTIPQANPIVLNASGLPASPIYINGGQAMKFIIQNSASVTQRTIDNIEGVNDPEFTGAVTQWVNYSASVTFVNATSFSVVGDQTLIFQVYRRVKTTNSGGTVYSTISNSVFGSGVTTVTVINDSGVLDSGLSNVQYSLLEATNPSIPESAVGRLLRTAANFSTAFASTRIDVASATTVNLTTSAPNTQHINITGTTTITGFTIAIGAYYFVRFNAALTLTNSGTLVTQTGANITTAAGDTCVLRATAANTVEVLFYTPAGLVPSSALPQAIGVSAVGTAIPYARADHVHQLPAWTTSSLSGLFQLVVASIPASVNTLELSLTTAGTNGTSNYFVQLGAAGALVTTGYSSGASGNGGSANASNGFVLTGSVNASSVVSGTIRFDRVTGNTWNMSFSGGYGNVAAAVTAGGSVALGNALDRFAIFTVSGADSFRAGSILAYRWY